MPESLHRADVVIIGGGLAGICAALELLDLGASIVLVERQEPDRLGGLARQAFGGIFFAGTPEQRRGGIRDSPELALADWEATAGFEAGDVWPRRWAEDYVRRSVPEVYEWLRGRGVRFFPAVHWVERGLFRPGNSVPRFHMVWGTGQGLVERLESALRGHPHAGRLRMLFGHRVERLETSGGRLSACSGTIEGAAGTFRAEGSAVVLASGGIAGNLARVRRHWPVGWGAPPETLLNGSHPAADGAMHDEAERLGARLTHMDRLWNYAAGVRHPRPRHEFHGLSLVPPKSALWLDSSGRRIGPVPLVTGYDTRFLVESVCRQPKKYSWQVMNWKIAAKELAVSGSEYNEAIRDRRPLAFLKTVLLGNPGLVRRLLAECPDFVSAGGVRELAGRMNALAGTQDVDASVLEYEIRRYDDMIARGPKYHNDDQLRRIAHVRCYIGDRLRTCAFQRILDRRALPLIAAREHILTRKSLGGIQTDLSCRALGADGRPVEGLWAVGEAAGFGGGGIHGLGSLEGTFLGACVLTGRAAAQALVRGKTA